MPRPLDIEILMHYCVSGSDFPRLGAPECKRTICDLLAKELLDVVPMEADSDQSYRATDGARVYLDALCAVPFPKRVWTIPESQEPSQ